MKPLFLLIDEAKTKLKSNDSIFNEQVQGRHHSGGAGIPAALCRPRQSAPLGKNGSVETSNQ